MVKSLWKQSIQSIERKHKVFKGSTHPYKGLCKNVHRILLHNSHKNFQRQKYPLTGGYTNYGKTLQLNTSQKEKGTNYCYMQ